MAGYDEVVERVARAIAEIEGEQDDMQDDWRNYAKAAIAILELGDEIGEGRYVSASPLSPIMMDKQLELAARRAREEMREACAQLMERGVCGGEKCDPQNLWHSGSCPRGLDMAAAAIRALPIDPPADGGGERSDKRDGQ